MITEFLIHSLYQPLDSSLHTVQVLLQLRKGCFLVPALFHQSMRAQSGFKKAHRLKPSGLAEISAGFLVGKGIVYRLEPALDIIGIVLCNTPRDSLPAMALIGHIEPGTRLAPFIFDIASRRATGSDCPGGYHVGKDCHCHGVLYDLQHRGGFLTIVVTAVTARTTVLPERRLSARQEQARDNA